jgi:hypothetical protein
MGLIDRDRTSTRCTCCGSIISPIKSVEPLPSVLLAIAGVFILTSLISVCPLYLPFGISTLKKEGKKSK